MKIYEIPCSGETHRIGFDDDGNFTALDHDTKAENVAEQLGAELPNCVIAVKKFEWGKLPGGELILIDEVLTPDSSRFWPKDGYRTGGSPPSFDKQFVRDWLETSGWDKNSAPPKLPDDVVTKTRAKYVEALQRLTGKDLVS